MNVKYISFTEKGSALALKISQRLGGEASRCGSGVSLRGWAEAAFASADALVFVGAVGIAVRAVAPLCRSKASDPAVVAVDECGRFAIPLLSGHLGGANDLARKIAEVCGAQAVITTATDINGVFAADEWAKRQGCAVAEPERIKAVSGALLGGKTVRCASAWPIAGLPPEGVELASNSDADFTLCVQGGGERALHIVPRIGVLGVGCKRGTGADQLERVFKAFARANGLFAQCVCAAATIDLKRDEAGLAGFCERHGWPLSFYSARELEQAEGSFAHSDFVQRAAGVDNVCERAAALASGGRILLPKYIGSGVTMALALKPFAPDWSWQL